MSTAQTVKTDSTSSSSRSSSHKSTREHSKSSHSHSHKSKPPPKLIPTVDAKNEDTVKKKASTFQWEYVFNNPLPSLPVLPKKLHIPLSTNRLTRLTGGAMMQTRRHELLVDRFLSLPLDLVDTSIYVRPKSVEQGEFNERDRALLLTSALTNTNQSNARLQPTREQLMKQGYSNWARKPEYTANANFFDKGKQQEGLVDVRKLQLEEIARRRVQAVIDNSRQSQIDRIEQTFIDAQLPPVHPRKKHLQAVSVLPILPLSTMHATEHTSVENAWFEFDDSIINLPSTSTSSSESTSSPSSLRAPVNIVLKQDDARSLYVQSDDALADADTLHETYAFKRDYVLLPTARVDPDNNFYFLVTENEVLYARYNTRQRLGKRMRQRMELEKELMEQRPANVEIEFVDALEQEENTRKNADENTRSIKRRRNNDEEEDEEDGDE